MHLESACKRNEFILPGYPIKRKFFGKSPKPDFVTYLEILFLPFWVSEIKSSNRSSSFYSTERLMTK